MGGRASRLTAYWRCGSQHDVRNPDEQGRAVGARMVRITPSGRGRRLVPGVGFRSERVTSMLY
jgi:hypothetical protein